MAIGKCLRCDAVGKVTEDHVVPQWFIKQIGNFGLSKKDLPSMETEVVCEKCNSTKGGKFDFQFPACRAVMKPIIQKWVEDIRKYEEFNP